MAEWQNFNKTLNTPTNDGEVVYAKIIDLNTSDSGRSNSPVYQLSLIRETMLEYEEDFFFMNQNNQDRQVILENYTPYLYEFYPDENELRKILHILDLSHDYTWVKMRIYDQNTQQILNDSDQIVITGISILSASPLVKSGNKLVFTVSDSEDPDVLKINENFKKPRLESQLNKYAYNSAIKSMVEQVFLPGCEGHINILNVGQGNFIHILMHNNQEKKNILFDIGMTENETDFKSNEIQYAYNEMIPSFKPDAIILSHWDMDHLLGIGALDPSHIYHKTVWMAPDLMMLSEKNISQSAYRLCFYLAYKSHIYLVKSNDYQKPVCQDPKNNFYIWQGCGTGTGGANKANNIGLLLEIKNVDLIGPHCTNLHWFLDPFIMDPMLCLLEFPYCIIKKHGDVLLPGDCAYKAMPQEIQLHLNEYKILMVPHHATDKIIPDFCTCVKEDKAAIVSWGKNRHNHPGRKHLEKLIGNYQIFETPHTLGYIIQFRAL